MAIEQLEPRCMLSSAPLFQDENPSREISAEDLAALFADFGPPASEVSGVLAAAALGHIEAQADVPTLSVLDATVAEGASGQETLLYLTVSLTPQTDNTVTVQVATVDGSASAAEGDYASQSRTLTFTPNLDEVVLTLAIQGDALSELDEDFFIELSNPNGAELARPSAKVTIIDDDPLPGVEMQDLLDVEGNEPREILFPVFLNAESGAIVTVPFTTADDTAHAPEDYAAKSGVLTFAPGQTEQFITLSIVGDASEETDEFFHVNLEFPKNAVLVSSQADIVLQNDDPPPSISIGDVTVDEAGEALVEVLLSASSFKSVTVGFATADGTAQDGLDYTGSSGALTFAPGEIAKTIPISTLADDLDEFDESFFFDLLDAANATVIDGQAVVTIADDPADVPPTVSVADLTVDEGSDALVEVTLSAPSGKPVTVVFATADGTAADGLDYSAAAGALTFEPGVTVQTVPIPTLADELDEDDETFFVSLEDESNATIADGDAVVTITDDPNDVPPSIAIGGVSVAEGDDAVSTVTLSAPSGKTVTVSYSLGAGTALAGEDFVPQSGALTFEPGVVTQTITIATLDDELDEDDETFFVNLEDESNATIAVGDAVVTIVDGDPPPTISIGDVGVDEGDNAILTVTLSAPSAKTVTASYSLGTGTALAGLDFTPQSGALTFDPGVVTRTIAIATLADDLDEDDETFFVNLEGASNATIADGDALVTILDGDPPPTISIGDVSVVEGDNAALTVTLSAPSAKTVTVSYSLGTGTALAGLDFTPQSGTLTFDPGTVTQAISIATLADDLDEDDETFFVNLENASNATIADGDAVVTIVDGTNGELPTVSIGDVTVAEGEVAQVTLTLSNSFGMPITLVLATADGAALADVDYTPHSQTVAFAPGETVQTIPIATISDALDEDDETFTVVLSNPSNVLLPAGPATVTITDDDLPPGISIGDATAAEGSDAQVQVTLSAESGKTITVVYATANGTALAGVDYTQRSDTLTFAPGVTAQSIPIPTLADLLDEDNETFSVSLSNPSNVTLGEDVSGVVTITDDPNDLPPTISIDDVTVAEGSDAVLTVTLSVPSGRTVMVNFATSIVSSLSPPDYDARNGVLTFAPGITTQTITVPTLADTLDEDDETFTVTLSNAVSAAIADGEGQVTIIDDDPPPTVSIGDAAVTEGGVAIVTVTLSAASGKTVTVAFNTSGGSALSGQDFIPQSGMLTFLPSITTQTVTVPTVGDSVDENDETFTVTLASPANASPSEDSIGLVTILDDDLPPTVSIGDTVVTEGGTAVLNVTLSNESGKTVTVAFTTSSGTAGASSDFVPQSGVLTFAPGVTSQSISIATVADTTVDKNETFSVNLVDPTNASIGRGTAQVSIIDNGSSGLTEAAVGVPPQSNFPNVTRSGVDLLPSRRAALSLVFGSGGLLTGLEPGGGGTVREQVLPAQDAGFGRAAEANAATVWFPFTSRSGQSGAEVEGLLRSLADADQLRLLALDTGDEPVVKRAEKHETAKPPAGQPADVPAVAVAPPNGKNLWWLLSVPLAALLGALGWYYRRRALGAAHLTRRRFDH